MEIETQVQDQEPQEVMLSDDERMAAFEAGLSGKRPTETPVEQEEVTPEPTPEPPAPKFRQITEDEYTELTARAAKVIDLEQTQKRDRDALYGSIGALKQSITSRQGGIALPKEKLDALRTDLPEVADLFDAMAQATTVPVTDPEAVFKATEEKLKPALDQIEVRAEDRALKRMRAELLSEAHPSWQTETGSPEFQAFVKAKGDEFMARLTKASDDWDHRFIGSALAQWKEAKKKATDTASARRDRLASNVNPRGTAAPTEAPPSRDEAFNAGLRKVSGR